MSEYAYRVICEPLIEGGFQVIVPALPGIVTYGSMIEEAREMAQDAIACHLQGLLKDNEEIPDDPFTTEAPVIESGSRKLLIVSPNLPPPLESGLRPSPAE